MQINRDLAYLIGFFIGDGNLSNNYLIRATTKNKEFAQFISTLFYKLFNKKPNIYFDRYNNSFVVYTCSKDIWSFFVDDLKIPFGTKSRIVEIPRRIMKSDLDIKTAFVSGLYDAEASVVNMIDKNIQMDT